MMTFLCLRNSKILLPTATIHGDSNGNQDAIYGSSLADGLPESTNSLHEVRYFKERII